MTKVQDFVFFAWLGLLLIVTCFLVAADSLCLQWMRAAGDFNATFVTAIAIAFTLGVWNAGLGLLDAHFLLLSTQTWGWVHEHIILPIIMTVLLVIFAVVVFSAWLTYPLWRRHQQKGGLVGAA